MPKKILKEQRKPDFAITVSCRKSKLSEDILVSHKVEFGKLISTAESRYPAEQGEALTTEFIKGIQKLQDMIELEAKNNPLIKQP